MFEPRSWRGALDTLHVKDYEEFEDTKKVIKSRELKDKQCKTAIEKKTSNPRQITEHN